MAKKKKNTTVVNNIESISIEIDYDKLAEAIVKAQTKASKQKKQLENFVVQQWAYLMVLFMPLYISSQ